MTTWTVTFGGFTYGVYDNPDDALKWYQILGPYTQIVENEGAN